MSRPADPDRTYHCVGVGVGPANLSLASLLHSHPEVTHLFFDGRREVGWHDGQLAPDTTLQVSMLKDLVTLADPTNPYSFLSYLHSRGRLYQFINAGFDAVPRREYRDYLEWARDRNPNLALGEPVESIGFDGDFTVATGTRTIRAHNVVIGVGKRPWVPSQAAAVLGPTQFHVSEFTDRARDLGGRDVVVIGGGQSGAEAFLDLIRRPEAGLPRTATWISRRANFFPLDDSPFTNEYFSPSFSDRFFDWDTTTRKEFNAEHLLASDGISAETLRGIYRQVYTHRFINGRPGLVRLCPDRSVAEVERTAGGAWSLTVVDRRRQFLERQAADIVIWATGFRSTPTDFLAPIAGRLEREADEYLIDPDFAVVWDGPADRGVFLQNAARSQRGLPDPNLSLLAWRSQRIVNRIRGVAGPEPGPDSLIDWPTTR